jgi:nucleotide-binding universal stress UspA family protein
MIKRILVGLGGTGFTSVAIRRAVDLAQIHEAHLTGVTVIDAERLRRVGPVPLGAGEAAHELREHRLQVSQQRIEDAISEFANACNLGGVTHCVSREEGDPFELLMSRARYHDLIIFGLRSIFDYGILGDEDYDPSDILCRLLSAGVRPIIAVSKEYRPIRRVLIAYSGSMESAKTMRRFIQLHLWPDVTLRIVTFQHSLDKGKRLCADAADYCRAHGLEPEVHTSPGLPEECLLPEAADWEADLIVIGNSARGLLLRKLFGETALHVIRNADLPLFLCQ